MFGSDNQPIQTYTQQPTNSEQATTSANKIQKNNKAMKFFCTVMLVGTLVSCSHGRADPTDMLVKVNFNMIVEEMDMKTEVKRGETRRCVVRMLFVVWRVCTST